MATKNPWGTMGTPDFAAAKDFTAADDVDQSGRAGVGGSIDPYAATINGQRVYRVGNPGTSIRLAPGVRERLQYDPTIGYYMDQQTSDMIQRPWAQGVKHSSFDYAPYLAMAAMGGAAAAGAGAGAGAGGASGLADAGLISGAADDQYL